MNQYYDNALKLYHNAKFFFVGSIDSIGFPNIKAVLVASKKTNMCEIIIKTNTSSQHVQQFKNNANGCLYFYSILGFKGTLLKGTYTVVEDVETKMKFWKKGDEKFYSKGEQDFCLLVFKPTSGRYYHSYQTGDFKIQ